MPTRCDEGRPEAQSALYATFPPVESLGDQQVRPKKRSWATGIPHRRGAPSVSPAPPHFPRNVPSDPSTHDSSKLPRRPAADASTPAAVKRVGERRVNWQRRLHPAEGPRVDLRQDAASPCGMGLRQMQKTRGGGQQKRGEGGAMGRQRTAGRMRGAGWRGARRAATMMRQEVWSS